MKKILFILSAIAGCWLLPAVSVAADIPSVLSDADATAYTAIFDAASANKTTNAKTLLAAPSDDALWCDARRAIYMSKTYRTSGTELHDWMARCNARPGADQIHKLAVKRGISVHRVALPRTISGAAAATNKTESLTTKKYAARIQKQINQFSAAINRGSTLNAKNILLNPTFKKSVSATDYGRMSGRLAFSYFTNGETELARQFSGATAEHSEYGLWTRGLLQYSAGDFALAEQTFAKMLKLPQIGTDRRIEVSFWAGRSAEMANDVLVSHEYYGRAANHPTNFYGALANAAMGSAPNYAFYDEDCTDADIDELSKTAYGRAALAALQIDKRDIAEENLRLLITSAASDKLLHAVHALANTVELPRASMQIAGVVKSRGIIEIDSGVIASSQYPLPDWEPMGGWSVDRALLFAIARQESGFRTNAKSGAGAGGVMQIMPSTAKLIARQQNIKMSDIDMSNPENNMGLGQQYITDILQNPIVDNNIVKMLLAYNAGAGNVQKFDKTNPSDDPLLYIESFPIRESRDYVRRVMANLWLYRARLGQDPSGMTDLASGAWPMYNNADEYANN